MSALNYCDFCKLHFLFQYIAKIAIVQSRPTRNSNLVHVSVDYNSILCYNRLGLCGGLHFYFFINSLTFWKNVHPAESGNEVGDAVVSHSNGEAMANIELFKINERMY